MSNVIFLHTFIILCFHCIYLVWPSHDLVREICQDGCHLVAKQPKGITVPDNEKGFFWRFSFSTAEKKLFLRGGHGEASSCRKQVLRILKALKEELSLHPLKSYHLKTLLLYAVDQSSVGYIIKNSISHSYKKPTALKNVPKFGSWMGWDGLF